MGLAKVELCAFRSGFFGTQLRHFAEWSNVLEIQKITKIYKTAGFVQKALDNVSVNFRSSEFASILGPSGSGKTTFLNIIGGLDHYDSGDLRINEISTKNFRDADWDSYRNHRIGFVFQSYNLISHQTVLKNVELALTLSGVSPKERTSRAKKALKDVGLQRHYNKRPSQLSGGQMQRVAIARALVNNPDILLADEPTGALDSETSLQIMNLLKKIAKKKLVIMVTHNPELAEQYSTRIITLKDGKIIKDTHPYDGKKDTREEGIAVANKAKKTRLKYHTALGLSFNNLMTKKARTLLVALAGSIGIIGIALIMAVSTGFQNYVDSIQETTLTSYPLTIENSSSDLTSLLFDFSTSDTSDSDSDSTTLLEKQYVSDMFTNISVNDLGSLKAHLEETYSEVADDLSNVVYGYDISPNIYTIDAADNLVKVSPSDLVSEVMGTGFSMLGSYSSMAKIYTQMPENIEPIAEDYEVLAGRWPENFDELIIVLPAAGQITDLVTYYLGLRDTSELTTMLSALMSGESASIDTTPLELTYNDLLNLDLRLILPTDLYQYNSEYGLYEDLSTNSDYLNAVYDSSLRLKVVGVVAATGDSTALNHGVNYRPELISYISNAVADTAIVKAQLADPEVNVLTGKRFDDTDSSLGLDFSNLISVDTATLSSAFNINLDQATIAAETESYITSIIDDAVEDPTPIYDALTEYYNSLLNALFDEISYTPGTLNELTASVIASNYETLATLAADNNISEETLKNLYSGLLNIALEAHKSAYASLKSSTDPDFILTDDTIIPLSNEEFSELGVSLIDSVKTAIANRDEIFTALKSFAIELAKAKVASAAAEQVVGLTTHLSSTLASSFNVDPSVFANAISINFSESELESLMASMLTASTSTTTAATILTSLGYQDLDSPTYISFYFTSFDGKEHFLTWLDAYNATLPESDRINYSDTTGILMGSVRTIVNAVSYVLIAFVSISLVVSSIMIGVITYISVYERTKEIGILRAIGASKRNISSIFNAETFIIGLLSGLIAIGFSYIAIPIINLILDHVTNNIGIHAALAPSSAFWLIVLSVILTLIGGLIPARKASTKDPVEALRSE